MCTISSVHLPQTLNMHTHSAHITPRWLPHMLKHETMLQPLHVPLFHTALALTCTSPKSATCRYMAPLVRHPPLSIPCPLHTWLPHPYKLPHTHGCHTWLPHTYMLPHMAATHIHAAAHGCHTHTCCRTPMCTPALHSFQVVPALYLSAYGSVAALSSRKIGCTPLIGVPA